MTTELAPETRGGIPADTFATRLRLARIYAGGVKTLTIDEAAERCSLKPASWSNWERGIHRPPHFEAMVKAIASGLGVDEEWLRDGGPLAPDPGPTLPPVTTLGDQRRSSGHRKSATRRNSVYCSMVSGDTVAKTNRAA